MIQNTILVARAVNLTGVSTNEEVTSAITSLLESAIVETSSTPSLSTLFHEISQAGAAFLLDPLGTLPLLLPSKDPSAKDIINLLGESCLPKEVIIAVQEAIERLERSFDDRDADDEVDEKRSDKTLSVPAQVATLIELYASCIPRLKLRRKSASDTIDPLFVELESVIQLTGPHSSRDEGRTLIVAVSRLIKQVTVWAKANATKDDLPNIITIFRNVLECTISAFEHCVQSSLTQRSFEQFFPQLIVRSAVSSHWEGGSKAIMEAAGAYTELEISEMQPSPLPSTSSMIVFAHLKLNVITLNDVVRLIPIIVVSIQTGSALDEALAILLHGMEPLRRHPRPVLPEEVIHPMFANLPTLSSTHPDALVRHQAFRILSLILSSCLPPLRLQFLKDLATNPYFPQMRVAAIGLIKEAVLDAVARAPITNIFASATFLKVLGPVVFQASPPDLFAEHDLSMDAFMESSEPARLVECLGLYNTLLQRDEGNMTHIRDIDMLNRVEKTLLYPLRTSLERWAPIFDGNLHDMLPLASLQISLQRVDEARSMILDPRGSSGV